MSCDFAVWYAEKPLTADEALSTYIKLCEEDVLDIIPSNNVSAFLKELTDLYPQLDDLEEDEIENSPWSVAHDVSPGHVIMAAVWPCAEEIEQLVRYLAIKHSLVFFDPQKNIVITPHHSRMFAITVEGDEGSPTFSDSLNFETIHQIIEFLTPKGGPSFVILSDYLNNYVQTAGGDGQYVVEWRNYKGPDEFEHWIAGKESNHSEFIKVPANQFEIKAQANECLSSSDVKQIFLAFKHSCELPKDFLWRDITAEFLLQTT